MGYIFIYSLKAVSFLKLRNICLLLWPVPTEVLAQNPYCMEITGLNVHREWKVTCERVRSMYGRAVSEVCRHLLDGTCESWGDATVTFIVVRRLPCTGIGSPTFLTTMSLCIMYWQKKKKSFSQDSLLIQIFFLIYYYRWIC